MKLLRIVAPHFVAGLDVDDTGRVTKAAPIIGWMVGKTLAYVSSYCGRKGWRIAECPRHA